MSLHLEDLSSFGRLAVKLDGLFSELDRLSRQIERLDIESESGLELSVKLLNQFAGHAKAISQDIQGFSAVLQEARGRSEAAAALVAERSQLILQRKQQQKQMREQLNRIEQEVKAANSNLANLKKDGNSAFNGEERLQIRAGLAKLNEELKRFLTDAHAVREAAGQAKFKSIEHNAKDLLDALRSSSRRIEKTLSES